MDPCDRFLHRLPFDWWNLVESVSTDSSWASSSPSDDLGERGSDWPPFWSFPLDLCYIRQYPQKPERKSKEILCRVDRRKTLVESVWWRGEGRGGKEALLSSFTFASVATITHVPDLKFNLAYVLLWGCDFICDLIMIGMMPFELSLWSQCLIMFLIIC